MKPIFLLAIALMLSFVYGQRASAVDTKPNIVVILADDLGYADIGVHGCNDIPTKLEHRTMPSFGAAER